MRALKFVLAGLFALVALTAGFVVAAVIALAGLTVFVSSRLLGRSRIRESHRPVRRSPAARSSSDAIDVTATEVEPAAAGSLPHRSPHHDHIKA